MTTLRLLAVFFASTAFALNEKLLEQECPVDCHCHYFRINWVTDCSDSNLTTIPYNELSHNVYILDMNDNNIANDILLTRIMENCHRLTTTKEKMNKYLQANTVRINYYVIKL
jgi:hypothetical protein